MRNSSMPIEYNSSSLRATLRERSASARAFAAAFSCFATSVLLSARKLLERAR